MKQISHDLAKALMAEGFPVEVRYFAALPNKGRCPTPTTVGTRATPCNDDTLLRLTAKKLPAERKGSLAAKVRRQVRSELGNRLNTSMKRSELIARTSRGLVGQKVTRQKVASTISKMLSKGYLMVAE